MRTKDLLALAGWGAAAVAILYMLQPGGPLASILPAGAQPVPLAAYPEFAYTAQPVTTSMAATPAQQAHAAQLPATPYFQSVQEQEQSAILAQCVASNICSPLYGDTQLGF